MHTESGILNLTNRVIQQVELDSLLALDKAKYSIEMSATYDLRCVDSRSETGSAYGRQLWFFEAVGTDSNLSESRLYGVLQYSMEYGLLELVEGHVFDCQRERVHFQRFYETGKRTDHWLHPANRWLLTGLATVGLIWLTYLSTFLSW